MKTMSWSRYHALSWSFARIRSDLHGRGAKRARRTARAAAIAVSTAPAVSEIRHGTGEPERLAGAEFGFLANVSRPINRIFRTRALPGETDI